MAADSDTTAKVGVEANVDDATAAINKLKESFGSLGESAKGHVEGVNGVFDTMLEKVEHVKGVFAAVTAALAGGALFTEAVSETQKMTVEVNKLSTVLGIARQDAMALATGLEMIGSSSEAYIGTVQRMTQRLKSGEESFNDMGVATRDSNGDLLNAQEVLQNVIKHLDEMKEGTDRNLEATSLLGRNWASTILFGRLNAEMLEEIKHKQEALDMHITGVSVEATYKYMGAMTEAKEVFHAVALSAGQTMMPRLTETAEWFANIGPPLVRGFNEVLTLFIQVIDTLKDVFGQLVGTMTEGLKNIGEALGMTFGEEGVKAIDIFVFALKVIETAVIYLRAGIETAFAVIKGTVEASVNILFGYSKVAQQALTPGANYVERVKAAWAMATTGVEDAVRKTASNVQAIAIKMQADLTKVFEVPMPKEPDKKSGGEGTYSGGGAASTFVADAQAELKLLIAKEDIYHQHSKQMEAEFWMAKLNTLKNGTEEYTQVYIILREAQKSWLSESETDEKRAMEVRITAAGQHKKEQAAIAAAQFDSIAAHYKTDTKRYQDALKEKEKYALAWKKEQEAMAIAQVQANAATAEADINLAQTTVKFKESMGQLDGKQALQQTQALEDQKYQIKLKALQDEIKLYDGDEKGLQDLLNKKRTMEQQYEAWHITAAQQSALLTKNAWESMLSPISSAFGTAITGMIQGTLTLRKAMANIFSAILGEFVKMLAEMMTRWAAMEAYKLVTTQAGTAERAALEESSTLMSIIKAKLQSLGLIQSSAATGAAGAGAAVAGVPIVGPAMVPETMAMVYGEIMGMAASASRGYDIPAGVNPLTQLHQKEMVLPAEQADVIRNLANNGGGGAGAVHFHVHAADPAGVRKFFLDNTGAMTEALRRAARNFTPVMTS